MHSSCFKNVCYATFKKFDLGFAKIFAYNIQKTCFIFLLVGTKFMVICWNKTVSAQIRYLSYFTTYQNWFWDTSEGYRKHLICINIVAYCNHYMRQQNIVRCLLLLFMKIYMVIVAVQSIIVTRSCINLFFCILCCSIYEHDAQWIGRFYLCDYILGKFIPFLRQYRHTL